MISESQLDTWSKQGSVAQSKATYATVRNVLEHEDAPYAGRDYATFLQGSYANDTNIYADSDVDIVICLNSSFYSDVEALEEADRKARDAYYGPADYSYNEFKADVIGQLKKGFGASVTPGKKAIFIMGNGSRRDADVLPAALHRRYFRFKSGTDLSYAEGICFWLPDGTKIINYPKQHSANCTLKHQTTAHWFKPAVRIIKNMRNAMVGKSLIPDGLAPSYFLEGMLYNVPTAHFGTSYQKTIAECLNWLRACDRAKLVCANEQYFLLHPTSPVTWREEMFERFLKAAIEFFLD
jgi:hypothetical protein